MKKNISMGILAKEETCMSKVLETMTLEQSQAALNALKGQLELIKKRMSNGVNVFDAVGMQTQEVKHSAFLAWLMNPSNPHGLKATFLRCFLEQLFEHHNRYEDAAAIPNLKHNRRILKEFSGITSPDELEDFLNADDLTVETEKVIIDAASRIDIFLESQKTKTLLLIENKVFTGTHDEQLSRYETKELKHHADFRKILVYLTPNGDMPLEYVGGKEVYRENWCVCSYETILKIIASLRIGGSPENKLRTEILLEDYVKMVNTVVLKNNPELRTLCKEIRSQYKDAIEILLNYSDNARDVIQYCKERFMQEFPDLKIIDEQRERVYFDFVTPSVISFFERHTENPKYNEIRYKFVFHFGFSKDNGSLGCGCGLEKSTDLVWTDTQKLLSEVSQNAGFTSKNKKLITTRFYSYTNFCPTLLDSSDREVDFKSKDIQQVLKKLDDNLEKCFTRIHELNELLDKN